MAYSTMQDVRLILSGFADPHLAEDPDYTPAMLGDAQVEFAISDADSQIDSVVRRIYNVPLVAPVPSIIHSVSVDIAAYLCDMVWRGSRELPSELSPTRILYDRALRLLDRIGRGELPLYNVGEGPDPVGNTSVVINAYPDDVLLDRDVYPRGNSPDKVGSGAEYSTVPIPYHPPWN